MTGRGRIREYASLCLAATCASYVIILSSVFLHEMAHGGTALALGGYFTFAEVGVGRGNAVYFFPLDTPAWKEVLVLLAGPLTNFGAAVVMLGWVAAGIEDRRGRLLALLTGELSALGFVFGSGVLSTSGLAGGGDVGRALGLLALPRVYYYVAGAVWLLLGAALAASLFRLFFRELAAYFPVATYGERLLLTTSAVVVPVCVIYGAQGVGEARAAFDVRQLSWHNPLPYAVLALAAITLALPLALARVGAAEGSLRFGVTRGQFLSLLAAALSLAAAQSALFGGGGDDRPPGLFLTRRPPEVNVSACNVLLTLGEDYRVRVRLLMRPFVEEQKFLWQRVKDAEPEDWGAYEQFARRKIPLMLGTDDLQITGHYSDPGAGFFNGTWDRGARVVEAEVNLSHMPYLKEGRDVRVLRIEDFWRTRGAGYIDFTEVGLEGDLQIGGLKSQPRDAGAPVFRSPKQLRWENTSFDRSFAVSYITIGRGQAQGD